MTTREIRTALDKERSILRNRLVKIEGALSAYAEPTTKPTKPKARASRHAEPATSNGRGRPPMSDEARALISAAQKKRWAAQKKSARTK